MAQVPIEIPVAGPAKLIKPKAVPTRRNSTGNSSNPISEAKGGIIPRHPRASLGSCHDICKFGMRGYLLTQRDGPNENNILRKEKPRSKNCTDAKKVSGPNKFVSVSARQKMPNQLRTKPVVAAGNAFKQPNRKGLKKSDVGKRGTADAAAGSPLKIPTAKRKINSSILKKVSSSKPQKTSTKTNSTNIEDMMIPEKIIHVVDEPAAEIAGNSIEQLRFSHEGNQQCCTELGSSTKSLEMDSAPEIRSTTVVFPEDQTHDLPSKKLKFQKGKVLDQFPHGNIAESIPGKALRRRASDGLSNIKNTNNNENPVNTVVLRSQSMEPKKSSPGLLNTVIEETASKLVRMRKSKVKALVGAFQSVINLHHSKSITRFRTVDHTCGRR